MLNSKDIEYQSYTLGDIGTVELLIAYRYKYDEYLFLGGSDTEKTGATGQAGLNTEIIATYADLDVYIESCEFDKVQIEMIKLVEEGYSHEQIAFELGLQTSAIGGRLRTIYRAIARENEWRWRQSVYKHKLRLRDKECNKCERKLPATAEFYSTNSDSRDGFYSYCKKCRK